MQDRTVPTHAHHGVGILQIPRKLQQEIEEEARLAEERAQQEKEAEAEDPEPEAPKPEEEEEEGEGGEKKPKVRKK